MALRDDERWDEDWDDHEDGFEIRSTSVWDEDGHLSAGDDETGPWFGLIVQVRRGDIVGDAALWGIEDGYGLEWRQYVADLMAELTDEAIEDHRHQVDERLAAVAA
jgi:hypothetical protein